MVAPSASDAREIDDLAEVDGYLSTLEEITSLLLEDGSLDQLLTDVLDLVARAIEDCAAASITVSEQGRYVTAASTTTAADAVDAMQYELRDGPCVDALETGREHYLEDLAVDESWPLALRERACQHGFGSLLALPLAVNGTTVGALNLFATESGGFPPHDRELAWRLAGPAAVTVANGRAYRELVTLSQQLQNALDRRAVIEQAKGIIVARSGRTPEEAFELLRELSQSRNRKLRDVAVAIVAARGHVADPDPES
jgi:transcriptional regulator with GAF, ATPase, and Fis domain